MSEKKSRSLYSYEDDIHFNNGFFKLTAEDAKNYKTADTPAVLPFGFIKLSSKAKFVTAMMIHIKDKDLPTRDFLAEFSSLNPQRLKEPLAECIRAGVVVNYNLVRRKAGRKNRLESVAYRLITHLVPYDNKKRV